MYTMTKIGSATIVLIISLTSLSMELEILLNLNESTSSLSILPRFWTNTGFCPSGAITNDEISNSLLSNDVKINLEYISALPNNGLSKVRIHWLFELVRFTGFRTKRVPTYDFTRLDQFLDQMVQSNLSVGFELMGNPDNFFDFKNASKNSLWQDLVFSIGRRYKIRYGTEVIKKWQFETWNEPDLKTYNLLNFTLTDYLDHLKMIRRALDAVGRTANNTHYELSGPAGLFKNTDHHILCWGALKYCNDQKHCPFDQITFHRKGTGTSAKDVIASGMELLKSIRRSYPKLKTMRISNNEADPISGWSTPRSFQSDVRYAAILVDTVLQHWSVKLNTDEFKYLDSISHDNAFLSYHPFEFDQRTLLARFQMNRTHPPHTQFVPKPVYIALGLLGNLGPYAEDISHIQDSSITYLVTKNHFNDHFYRGIVMILEGNGKRTDIDLNLKLPKLQTDEIVAPIVEAIECDITDPVKIWRFYGSPSYPNATIRKLMRENQGPIVINSSILKYKENVVNSTSISFNLNLKTPSIVFMRICSCKNDSPKPPKNLRLHQVNPSEILLFWNEHFQLTRCIKTYQLYFKKQNAENWQFISKNVHIPFLSFHFQPDDGAIHGDYKVRSIDVFGRHSEYSNVARFL